MTTKVRLNGHPNDLADLAQALAAGHAQVLKDDEGYFLTGPTIEHPSSGSNPYQEAVKLLPLLNGIGRVTYGHSFCPIALTGHYQSGPDQHAIVVAGTVNMRARSHMVVIRADGASASDAELSSSIGGQWTQLAITQSEVAEALVLLGAEPCGWVEMYKVFEIIRDAMKPIELEKSGLTTKTEIRSFTASANRPDISGGSARHARIAGERPQRTMSQEDAHAYIARLTTEWMNSLIQRVV